MYFGIWGVFLKQISLWFAPSAWLKKTEDVGVFKLDILFNRLDKTQRQGH